MPSPQPTVVFTIATEADGEALASLRVDAMRESLSRIGRFDPTRARVRFLSGFSPDHTRRVEVNGKLVGFFVVKPYESGLLLENLYVLPGHQGKGIGAAMIAQVFAEADAPTCSVRAGALRGSASNRFYVRHGFVLVEQSEFDNYYVRTAYQAL